MDDGNFLIRAVVNSTCPDCGTPGLIHGPCGGISMNVHCGKCGAKFNAHGGNWNAQKDLSNTFSVDRLLP